MGGIFSVPVRKQGTGSGCVFVASTWCFGTAGYQGRGGLFLFPAGPGEQKIDFFRRHQTVFSWLQSGKVQISESNPGQFQYKIVQRVKQPADFPVPPFRQGNPVPGVRLGQSFLFEFKRLDRSPVETDFSRFQAFQMGGRKNPLDFDKIGPGHFITGVENPLSQISVVGQEEDSFRLDVEPPHMDQGVDLGKELLEGCFPVGIMEGRYHTFRLVKKKQEGLRLDRNFLAVHCDLVGFRMNLCSRHRNDRSVDPDEASTDHLLGVSPGSQTAMGQKFL